MLVQQALAQSLVVWNGGLLMRRLLLRAHVGLMIASYSALTVLSLTNWVLKLGWKHGRVLMLKVAEFQSHLMMAVL